MSINEENKDEVSGFELSLSVARICVAMAALMAFFRYTLADYSHFLATSSHKIYQPKGVLGYFTSTPPSADFFVVVKYLTLIFTVFALMGLFSRLSMFLSFVGGSLLAGVLYSFIDGYCHGYQVIFITQLGLSMVRGIGTIGVESFLKSKGLISKKVSVLGVEPIWGMCLVQFLTAFMFFSAGIQKLKADYFQFGWISADNFRIHLIRRYPMLGETIPAHVEFIMNSEWLCFLMALLNILVQVTPILACFLFRYPRMRLALGLIFVGEILGLQFIMGLWNYHWLPLFFIFVDMEYFASAFRGLKKSGEAQLSWSGFRKSSLGNRVIVFCFVLVSLVLLVDPNYLVKHYNVFPFSNFGVYSKVFKSKEVLIESTEYSVKLQKPKSQRMKKWARAFESRLQRSQAYINRFKGRGQAYLERQIKFVAARTSVKDVKEVSAYEAVYKYPRFPAGFQRILVRRTLLAKYNLESDQAYIAEAQPEPDEDLGDKSDSL